MGKGKEEGRVSISLTSQKKGRGPKSKFEWVLRSHHCEKGRPRYLLTCTRSGYDPRVKEVAGKELEKAFKLFNENRRYLRNNCKRIWEEMNVRAPGDSSCSSENDDDNEAEVSTATTPSGSPISSSPSETIESASAQDKCNYEEEDSPAVNKQLPERDSTRVRSDDSTALRELFTRKRKLLELEGALMEDYSRNSLLIRDLLQQVNNEIDAFHH